MTALATTLQKQRFLGSRDREKQHAYAEVIRKALEAYGIQFPDNGEVAAGLGVVLQAD